MTGIISLPWFIISSEVTREPLSLLSRTLQQTWNWAARWYPWKQINTILLIIKSFVRLRSLLLWMSLVLFLVNVYIYVKLLAFEVHFMSVQAFPRNQTHDTGFLTLCLSIWGTLCAYFINWRSNVWKVKMCNVLQKYSVFLSWSASEDWFSTSEYRRSSPPIFYKGGRWEMLHR